MMEKSVAACKCKLVPEVSGVEGGPGVLRSYAVHPGRGCRTLVHLLLFGTLQQWFQWGGKEDGREVEVAAACDTTNVYESWSCENMYSNMNHNGVSQLCFQGEKLTRATAKRNQSNKKLNSLMDLKVFIKFPPSALQHLEIYYGQMFCSIIADIHIVCILCFFFSWSSLCSR